VHSLSPFSARARAAQRAMYYYCIYYLQIVTMAKLFGVSCANCQAEQQFPEMEKLGRYI